MHTNLLLKQLSDSLEQLINIIETFQKQDNSDFAIIEKLHASLANSSKLTSTLLVLNEQDLVVETPSVREESKEIQVDNLDFMIEPVFEIENNSEKELTVPITIVEITESLEEATGIKPIIEHEEVKEVKTHEQELVIESEYVSTVIDVSTTDISKEHEPVSAILTESELQPVAEEKSLQKELPKMGISLNDKFRFINDLFASNATEYHIAVEQINAIDSLNDLTNYLNGLMTIYGWQENNDVVKQFFMLARKRFI